MSLCEVTMSPYLFLRTAEIWPQYLLCIPHYSKKEDFIPEQAIKTRRGGVEIQLYSLFNIGPR